MNKFFKQNNNNEKKIKIKIIETKKNGKRIILETKKHLNKITLRNLDYNSILKKCKCNNSNK